MCASRWSTMTIDELTPIACALREKSKRDDEMIVGSEIREALHEQRQLIEDLIDNRLKEVTLKQQVKCYEDALVSIQANSAPNAISLSPRNRINAFHKITTDALELWKDG